MKKLLLVFLPLFFVGCSEIRSVPESLTPTPIAMIAEEKSAETPAPTKESTAPVKKTETKQEKKVEKQTQVSTEEDDINDEILSMFDELIEG